MSPWKASTSASFDSICLFIVWPENYFTIEPITILRSTWYFWKDWFYRKQIGNLKEYISSVYHIWCENWVYESKLSLAEISSRSPFGFNRWYMQWFHTLACQAVTALNIVPCFLQMCTGNYIFVPYMITPHNKVYCCDSSFVKGLTELMPPGFESLLGPICLPLVDRFIQLLKVAQASSRWVVFLYARVKCKYSSWQDKCQPLLPSAQKNWCLID